ncbi:ABC transporter permease [Natronospirillum operosum]|uniref:ABC transporter permease n=1 Tax=Natronospirillum operosum TaxID=2759953 RepID=A0A4Z0WHQ5_9GAMM|nr:ABC transporter permease [Natronospirillum operosum]TGG94873.1 ABC transporter permease [Natronospirillum operosum]
MSRLAGSRAWASFAWIAPLNGRILFGGGLVLLIVFIAAAAPLLATHDPLRVQMSMRLMPPSADNWLGTDNNGRDIYSRIVHGARVSVVVGMAVVILTTVIGTFIGLVSGYFRRLDGPLMRFMDALMSFPSILLAIAIVAALGASIQNVVIALTVSFIPHTARVVRGKVLSVREETFVESARAIGLGDWLIIKRYILPNVMAPLMVQATFILALAIIAEAGLSYIGAGTPPPQPSWGNILSDGRAYLHNAWWMTTFPGLFIMISVLGLNIMGDGLRDKLDPRMEAGR